MTKVDLYKQHRGDYVTPKVPVLLKIVPAKYLAIDGRGAPGGETFTAAVGALYNVAFTTKMARKFGGRQDYAVSKLEGLWHGDVATTKRDDWRWTVMIRTPTFVTDAERRQAIKTLLERGKPPEVKQVRFEIIREGRCVQMLHVGPYDREQESIAAMHAAAAAAGLSPRGPHHEVYLSDPRRVAPAKLRTILRQPVGK